jgi:Arc/MetJ-type ribon-helix-helix transcriptional regulator
MKRVNVTISEKMHRKGKEVGKEKYGSFSHLVRVGIQEKLDDYEGEDSTKRELAPVITEIQKLEESVEEVIENLDELQEDVEVVTTQSSENNAKVEHVEEKVIEELQNADNGLTVPDISERASLNVTLVQQAVESLSDDLLLNQVQTDGESETTRWELR